MGNISINKRVAFISLIICSVISGNVFAFSGDEGRYYLSAHLGYASQKIKQNFSGAFSDSASKDSSGLMQSVAMGYNLANDFRTDLSLIYMDKLRSKKSSAARTIKGENRNMGGFVNTYYSLFSDTIVEPYIMGGFGMIKSEFKTQVRGDKNDSAKKSKTKMAYRAGIGVDVRVGRGWSMDAHYGIINQLGNRKFNMVLDNGGITNVSARSQFVNVGMLGLRKTF